MNPLLVEATNQDHVLNHRFAEAYAALPETAKRRIESSLGGPPAVFISFSDCTPPGKWSRAIPAIVATLIERAELLVHGDDIPVWNVPALEDIVLELEVQHAGSGQAGLYAAKMTEVVDRTLALLRKK